MLRHIDMYTKWIRKETDRKGKTEKRKTRRIKFSSAEKRKTLTENYQHEANNRKKTLVESNNNVIIMEKI